MDLHPQHLNACFFDPRVSRPQQQTVPEFLETIIETNATVSSYCFRKGPGTHTSTLPRVVQEPLPTPQSRPQRRGRLPQLHETARATQFEQTSCEDPDFDWLERHSLRYILLPGRAFTLLKRRMVWRCFEKRSNRIYHRVRESLSINRGVSSVKQRSSVAVFWKQKRSENPLPKKESISEGS